VSTPVASSSAMNAEPKKNEQEPKAQPSEGPLKNEPTPERANEEKAKQEREARPDEG
jgi:hypothetical protein